MWLCYSNMSEKEETHDQYIKQDMDCFLVFFNSLFKFKIIASNQIQAKSTLKGSFITKWPRGESKRSMNKSKLGLLAGRILTYKDFTLCYRTQNARKEVEFSISLLSQRCAYALF